MSQSLVPSKSFRCIAKHLSIMVLLAGCTIPTLESEHLGPSSLLKSKIKRHYSQYAHEQGGGCNRPYIDAITKVDVVKDTPQQWVANIRYGYLDRLRDEALNSDQKICRGFASRTFALAPIDNDFVVTEMSGTECAGLLFSLNNAAGFGRHERKRTCPDG